MRDIPNPQSKMHPRWDGPFVVLASSDKDVYQLATANGYVIRNLVNVDRLRKLSKEERVKYRDEFWEASERLKSHDERTKREGQLLDVQKRLAEATTEHLQAQKSQQAERQGLTPSVQGQSSPTVAEAMTKIAAISTEKRDLEKSLKESAPKVTSEPKEVLGVGKRLRKLPWKLRGG